MENLKLAKAQIDSAIADGQDFLNYRNGILNWPTFKFKCLERHYNLNNQIINESFAEWLDNQITNTLSLQSSGGTYQALLDIDNIICNTNTEEKADSLYEYYNTQRKTLK